MLFWEKCDTMEKKEDPTLLRDQKKESAMRENHTENHTIEGRNPVYEALQADLPIDKIFLSETVKKEPLGKLLRLAKEKGVVVQTVGQTKLAALTQTDGAHQGIVAVCTAVPYVGVADILRRAEERGEPPFVVIADEIADPHNLGAIIRTANACGAHGVIIPKHRSVGLTAVVAKASAGALAHTPVAKVTNLPACMDELKERGLWITGADMAGEKTLWESDLTGAVGLVVGSEGKGMSRLVREKCDFLVRIPMAGQINSLNASVAASLLLYEVLRRRMIG